MSLIPSCRRDSAWTHAYRPGTAFVYVSSQKCRVPFCICNLSKYQPHLIIIDYRLWNKQLSLCSATTYAVDEALPAFTGGTQVLLLLGFMLGQTDGRMDGRTRDRCIDTPPHITRVVPIIMVISLITSVIPHSHYSPVKICIDYIITSFNI